MTNSGIPYFPLNCQLDEKWELIEAEYGLTGFAVAVKLLQRIYGEHGYYCEWTTEVALLFSRRLGMLEGRFAVSEIVNCLLRREIFSQELYDKYHILTSQGIQKRYFEAVSRRKKVRVIKEYLLVPATLLPSNVSIFEKNVSIFDENVDIFEQRKEEKRKEEKRKEEKRKVDSSFGKVFFALENSGFKISAYFTDEITHLIDEYNEDWLIKAIKIADERGNKTLSYIKGILSNWQKAGASNGIGKKETEYDVGF